MTEAARRRKQINVSSPAVAADWLRQELGRGELSCLFRRKDIIVHTPLVGEAGYIPPTDAEKKVGVDLGPAQVRPITTEQIKALIEVRYDVGKGRMVDTGEQLPDGTPKKRKQWHSELFPRAAATSAVEAGRIGEGTPNLQELHGVTHTPILRPDGSVLDQPGYDKSTGMLYLPDRKLEILPVPANPTVAQVKEAVQLLLTPIAEFPFVEEHHRANWLGYAITPSLRALLEPPYQGLLIDATNPGSGKGFLMGMLVRLHGGVLKGALPGDNEEMRKQITATLADTTAPFIVFDNITGVVRSAALEALLTTALWSDRWLGMSKDIRVPNDRIWAFTGNNAKIGGDLSRRVNGVRIDPGVADPQNRTGFKLHPPTWMTANRGRYLTALLTVARAWVLDGAPTDVTRSDDYMQWHSSIRGLLAWAGIAGRFGEASQEQVLDSSDDSEWAVFLEAIHASFGTVPFTVKALVERLASEKGIRGFEPIDPALLPGDLAHKYALIRNEDGDFRKSLGWWFRNREGRFAARWRVRRSNPKSARVAEYVVDPPACGFSVSAVSNSPAPPYSSSAPQGPTTSEPLSLPIGGNQTAKTAKPHGPNRWPTTAGSRPCTRCGFGLDTEGHALNCEQAA